MNRFSLVLSFLRAQALQSALCVFSGAAGIALICAIILLSHTFADAATRNSRNIDVVAGAKGSALQLVLSAVYHADIPAGNIDAAIAGRIAAHPGVRRVIPLALGDSVRGFRIVGTTPDYIALYGARMAEGVLWTKSMQAVAGARTGFRAGDRFSGAHGLTADPHDHDHGAYAVTGVLAPTGTVIDRLVLTSVQSVQEIHGHHEDAHEHEEAHEHDAHEHNVNAEITALLIEARSPAAAISLPREITRSTELTAASPAYEITRFLHNIGAGKAALTAAGAGFAVLAALMTMATMAARVSTRRYDLAVMRVLGGSAAALAGIVVLEGIFLGLAAGLAGIVAGHVMAFIVAHEIAAVGSFVDAAIFLRPAAVDMPVIAISGLCGALAALLPAAMAARTDIASLLAQGRI